MEPVLMYLLKMMTCSSLLYGYYRVVLYNERFHQWNRFYLLASMVLSVLVPFLRIPVMSGAEENNLAMLIASMPWNSATGVAKQQGISWQNTVLASAVIVSVIFFLKLLIGITRIVATYYSNPVSTLQSNVQLIVTRLTHAPFSFFNWLFWRKDIDPASAGGQRMLNHELTHIREYHSIDKLFTSLLLCVFWINPFFWLMQSELSMIHEFLADRKAVHAQDRIALAEMILDALPFMPRINSNLVNPFFSSQIKRRLLMISTSKEPGYSYLRRISGLVLMVCCVFALALSIQKTEGQKTEKNIIVREKPVTINAGSMQQQREKKKMNKDSGNVIYVKADTIFYDKNKNVLEGNFTITSSGEKVKKTKEYNQNTAIVNNKHIAVSRVTIISKPEEAPIKDTSNTPLYFLYGKEINAAEMKDLDAKLIKEIHVLKGEKAIEKYGDKAKNGAIEIKMKTKEEASTSKEKIL